MCKSIVCIYKLDGVYNIWCGLFDNPDLIVGDCWWDLRVEGRPKFQSHVKTCPEGRPNIPHPCVSGLSSGFPNVTPGGLMYYIVLYNLLSPAAHSNVHYSWRWHWIVSFRSSGSHRLPETRGVDSINLHFSLYSTVQCTLYCVKLRAKRFSHDCCTVQQCLVQHSVVSSMYSSLTFPSLWTKP